MRQIGMHVECQSMVRHPAAGSDALRRHFAAVAPRAREPLYAVARQAEARESTDRDLFECQGRALSVRGSGWRGTESRHGDGPGYFTGSLEREDLLRERSLDANGILKAS